MMCAVMYKATGVRVNLANMGVDWFFTALGIHFAFFHYTHVDLLGKKTFIPVQQ